MNDPGNRPTESPSKLLYFILCACVAALVATSIRGCIKLRRPPSPAAQQPAAQPRPQPKPQPARPAAPTQKPAAPEPVVSNAIPAEIRDDDETGMQGVVLPPDSPVPDDDYGVYISAALQALRKNLSEEEKLNAMAQVEMIGHPMVMPVVMEALDDDSIEVRQSAIESIRVLDDPCVIPAVVKALDDKDTVIRADAVECLLRVPDANANEALMKALDDPDPEVRESAFEVLVYQENPEHIPVLARALQSDNESVQQTAVDALTDIRDPRAVDTLIEQGLLSTFDSVREGARDMLRDMSGRQLTSYEEWRDWWSASRASCPTDNKRSSWNSWWEQQKKQ